MDFLGPKTRGVLGLWSLGPGPNRRYLLAMKLSALAAALAFIPAPAFADLGTAPTDAAPAAAPNGPLTQAKNALYDEIEAWRGTKLPHTDPPSQLTARLEPRLNEIKADVRVATAEADLAKPKKDLAAWEDEVLREKFAQDRKRGLAHGTFARYSKEEKGQAEFAANLRAAIAQDIAERSFSASSRGASAGAQNPSGFFDGSRANGEISDGAVYAGSPSAPNDPARYAKVRQILMSQGASARVVDMAIQEAIRQNADPLLVLAVINAESGFDTHATSYKRDRHGHLVYDKNGHKIPLARGLMQLMADTGRGLGVHDTSMLYDAQTNLRAGITFLKSLWGQFVGGSMTAIAAINPWTSHSVKSAVAAYNAGPGAVRKYSGVPPYRETQGYVKNVIGYYERFKQYMSA